MSWKKLMQQIRDGYGQGHFDAFRPWLYLRRRNPSKRGNQVAGDLPGYKREASFLARVEWHLALLVLWLGAADVREQFPLWPMSHPHPLADFPGEPSPHGLSEQPGLIEIARDAGIDHGWQVDAPKVPYVATVDLAVTRVVNGSLALSLLPVKPSEEVNEASPASRTIERLELQRRYAKQADATVAIADARLIGEHFGANLENYAAAARLPQHLSDPARLADFSGLVAERSAKETLNDAIATARWRFRLDVDSAALMFRAGVWRRLIDVDLSEYVVMSEPRRPGARLAAALERELFPAARPQ
jgi:hypothetical protein